MEDLQLIRKSFGFKGTEWTYAEIDEAYASCENYIAKEKAARLYQHYLSSKYWTSSIY